MKKKGLLGASSGSASAAHLEEGRPIYYRERNTEKGLLLKAYPDGRIDLVRFSPEGDSVVSNVNEVTSEGVRDSPTAN